jgi:predicted ATPase
MIESVRIRNFKSLLDVPLTLGQLTCLVGMNGAGKSTVLQAFDFLSQMFVGGIDDWLKLRDWSAADLHCKLGGKSNVVFDVAYIASNGEHLTWTGVFNRQLMRCSTEVVQVELDGDGYVAFHSNGRSYLVRRMPRDEGDPGRIAFEHQGSVLSALKADEVPACVQEFVQAMRAIRSLDLLSPHLLRKRARVVDQDIGPGGEKLSAYLDTIKGEDRARLLILLKQLYPTLVDFKVTALRAGWKKLSIFEQFGKQKLETDAAHMNDGLLRVLAVLAQTQSDRSLVLLDEIENGINQEVVQPLVEALVASQQQILLTTHSPLILNYLSDEVAREGVQFIYKSPAGETRVRPLFKIPRINDKLLTMGPGDALVDTDLRELTRECVAQDLHDSKAEAL